MTKFASVCAFFLLICLEVVRLGLGYDLLIWQLYLFYALIQLRKIREHEGSL